MDLINSPRITISKKDYSPHPKYHLERTILLKEFIACGDWNHDSLIKGCPFNFKTFFIFSHNFDDLNWVRMKARRDEGRGIKGMLVVMASWKFWNFSISWKFIRGKIQSQTGGKDERTNEFRITKMFDDANQFTQRDGIWCESMDGRRARGVGDKNIHFSFFLFANYLSIHIIFNFTL